MSFSEIAIIVGQFFLSLSLLIVLHEMGHFVPAKLFKTKVEKIVFERLSSQIYDRALVF